MSTQGRAQFTPGPWVVNTFIVNGQHKLEVLDATGANACVQANANLIAAAPAMYGELSVSTNLLCRALPYLPEDVAKELVKQRQINMQVLSQAEGRHHE